MTAHRSPGCSRNSTSTAPVPATRSTASSRDSSPIGTSRCDPVLRDLPLRAPPARRARRDPLGVDGRGDAGEAEPAVDAADLLLRHDPLLEQARDEVVVVLHLVAEEVRPPARQCVRVVRVHRDLHLGRHDRNVCPHATITNRLRVADVVGTGSVHAAMAMVRAPGGDGRARRRARGAIRGCDAGGKAARCTGTDSEAHRDLRYARSPGVAANLQSLDLYVPKRGPAARRRRSSSGCTAADSRVATRRTRSTTRSDCSPARAGRFASVNYRLAGDRAVGCHRPGATRRSKQDLAARAPFPPRPVVALPT